jgi:lipopolysaccharide transport system permease protein
LWRYRDLIGPDRAPRLVAAYKQTVLGPVWHLTEPTGDHADVRLYLRLVAKISTDGLPRILFTCRHYLWTFFSNGLLNTASTFNANAGVFGKVYFPRLVMPIATVLSSMIAWGCR